MKTAVRKVFVVVMTLGLLVTPLLHLTDLADDTRFNVFSTVELVEPKIPGPYSIIKDEIVPGEVTPDIIHKYLPIG